jgi:hypothetical protein
MQRILITGAAGMVATSLRPRLARSGRMLRLLDIRQPERLDLPAEAEEHMLGSVTDLDAMTTACTGVDAVVHLGGQSREASVGEVLHVNAYGAYCVLEAARRAGVTRVVLASSSHAVGFHSRMDSPGADLPADLPVRPDTLYGWSKAAVEAAGRLYVDRFGLDVICLRIGLWFPTPPGLRGLAMWLSPDDGARLVEACLAADSPGYRLIWGISRNTRRWWSLAEGEAIGFVPKDDAEQYAEQIIAEQGEPDWSGDPVLYRVGGQWCDVPLGEPY